MLSQGPEMEKQAPGSHGCFSWDAWRNLLLPQLNRQSLYVYGSEVAVEKECIRQREKGVFVIHPFSPLRWSKLSSAFFLSFFFFFFRSYYIMCMVAITFLNLIGIPIEIAFLDGQGGVGWEGFNVFSDTLFLVDVGLNFRMGFISEDNEAVILDLKSIRQNYLKSWFIPDMIAAFPVGYILLIADLQYHDDSPSSKASKMVRILMFVRILSLVRLLRVSRLVRFFNEVEKVSNANLEVVRVLFRILSLFMMIFLLCHWNGCVQYFVPMLEEFPSDCWVRRENLMLNLLEIYMTSMKLPKELRMRVRNYFQSRYGGKWYDEKDVLNWVSSSIKEEILMIMCSGLVRRVPLFSNCEINFINAILFHLQYEVFQEGDVIVYQNTPGDRMFFIERGQVVVETENYQIELCDGGYFGGQYEIKLLKLLYYIYYNSYIQSDA
ncbi:potassium/sodium hyperpolarization-activated cyclic nucleotide-gated channel 2-like [Ictalurus furcatus]|uniref:potassium/sodium hyperpolarization-activated cyclic nucleotide-gated channel 2-like n=1 Tax=Ictalurus furcatus TaxID=66913 RepID=UPI00235038F9|nr:potassium/sodium hyperpolarization-activated cyclic nucleotide-gated channel 2-like [Ictalurus furcatus]